MTTTLTPAETRRRQDLLNRLRMIMCGYGWPDDHSMVDGLMDEGALTEKSPLVSYENSSLHQLFDPYSAKNVCKTDGQLLVLTPFKRTYGPTPLNVADRHLPEDWHKEWTGIMLESRCMALTRQHGEIIRFYGAGGGNSTLLENARYIILHYMSRYMSDMPLHLTMETLDEKMKHLPSTGIVYGNTAFVRGGLSWQEVPSI